MWAKVHFNPVWLLNLWDMLWSMSALQDNACFDVNMTKPAQEYPQKGSLCYTFTIMGYEKSPSCRKTTRAFWIVISKQQHSKQRH